MELLPVELVGLMPTKPVAVVVVRCCKAPSPQLPERLIRLLSVPVVAMAETAEILRFHQLRLLAVATQAVVKTVAQAVAAIQVETVEAAVWLAVAAVEMVALAVMQTEVRTVAVLVAYAQR
jgi:hypothetical protein